MITNECKVHAEEVKAELKEFFKENKTTLAILTNGRPEGERYIRNKIKVAEELGVEIHVYDYTDKAPMGIPLLLKQLPEDGIMIQMPFHENPWVNDMLMQFIPPEKDVDGLNFKTKHLYGIYPATARGIFECFFKDTCLHVGVMGRSKLVGDPLVNLLMHSDNVVTVVHSKCPAYWSSLDCCDAIVTATGTTTIWASDISWLNYSRIELIVDVGIRVGEDGKLRGDVDKELYDLPDVKFTPVPNGVGLLTTTYLYWNLKQLKEFQR